MTVVGVKTISEIFIPNCSSNMNAEVVIVLAIPDYVRNEVLIRTVVVLPY